jgi:hypothetical protein
MTIYRKDLREERRKDLREEGKDVKGKLRNMKGRTDPGDLWFPPHFCEDICLIPGQ